MADLAMNQPLWLLALPLAWWLPWQMGRLGKNPPDWFEPLVLRLPSLEAHTETTTTTSASTTRWLLLPILALLVLALSGPVRVGTPIASQAKPADLVILLDVSLSMGLQDYEIEGQPISRLTMAKQVLDNIAQDYQGARMGLVIVGRPSGIWSPLTRDRDLFRHLLSRVQANLAGRNAAIGDALVLTAKRFANDPAPVAILITDGNFPVGRYAPEHGATRLKEAGIPLYTIAMGSLEDTQTIDGTSAGKNQQIHQSTDLNLLKKLAEQTGGLGFHVSSGEDIKTALAQIAKRHIIAAPDPIKGADTPLYPWPLALAILLLGLMPWLQRGRRQAA